MEKGGDERRQERREEGNDRRRRVGVGEGRRNTGQNKEDIRKKGKN